MPIAKDLLFCFFFFFMIIGKILMRLTNAVAWAFYYLVFLCLYRKIFKNMLVTFLKILKYIQDRRRDLLEDNFLK